MAGVSQTFLTGTQCVIELGGLQIATAQAINFSENLANQFVTAMGAFGPIALEPLQYGASGAMTIQKYSDDVLKGFGAPESDKKPHTLQDAKNPLSKRLDGNSLNFYEYSSPLHMMTATTFDIKIKAKSSPTSGYDVVLFILRDCRITGYSFGIQANGLVSENINLFIKSVQEPEVEPLKNNLEGTV
jgi:hypothetical protein